MQRRIGLFDDHQYMSILYTWNMVLKVNITLLVPTWSSWHWWGICNRDKEKIEIVFVLEMFHILKWPVAIDLLHMYVTDKVSKNYTMYQYILLIETFLECFLVN